MKIRSLMNLAIALVLSVVPAGLSFAESSMTKEPLWKSQVCDSIWSSPALQDGVLYFGCDDGNLYAFDTNSKQVKWQFVTEGIIRSSVELVEGTLFFAGDDGFLHALALENGEELWQFDLESATATRNLPATDPPYDYDYLHSSPVYQDGIVYVGSASGKLYAVDAKTGQEQWHFSTDAPIRSTPCVYENTVYVGNWDHHLYALDTKNGEEKWRFNTKGIIQSSPVAGDGKILIGSRSAKVFAVNAATGELEWSFVHPDQSWVESSAVYQDGKFYMGSSDALKLFVFDADSGNIVWEFNTGGWAWSTPVVTDDTVYIGGISAYPYYFEGVELQKGFYAVDKETGQEKWRLVPEASSGYITGGVFSSAVESDGIVYIGGLDGYIYAVEK